MSLEEEMSNPSDEEIIRILHQRLQTAKEENEKLRNLLGKPYKRRIDLENNKLTQQNKQMREALEKIVNDCTNKATKCNICSLKKEPCTSYIAQQALKGVE